MTALQVVRKASFIINGPNGRGYNRISDCPKKFLRIGRLAIKLK